MVKLKIKGLGKNKMDQDRAWIWVVFGPRRLRETAGVAATTSRISRLRRGQRRPGDGMRGGVFYFFRGP